MSPAAKYAHALLRKAREDQYAAGRLAADGGGPVWVIGFHAQQAVEKEEEEAEDSAFRQRVELFEAYSRDELNYPKIFSELGFTFVDDGCDGYCPECPNQRKCETYPELKAEWEEVTNGQ